MRAHRTSRREFFKTVAAGSVIFSLDGCASAAQSTEQAAGRLILFHSKGAIGAVSPDGGPMRIFGLHVPGQVSWHVGPAFKDRRRVILMSVEGQRTWEHNVRSHLWIYDVVDGSLNEIAQKDPPAVYMPACALLPGEDRLVVNPIIEGEQCVMTMNLDGSDQRAVTRPGEGFTYCVGLSPDAKRLTFHATGPHNYQIFVINLDGSNRTLVAADPQHLYFGPTWSRDGEWLLYLDCHPATDPGHDWADLCINRPNGKEHRLVTQGQRHWFGTSYGGPTTRGGGSNIPEWSPKDLVCTYTRALPNSQTAWRFNTTRPDTDHFNRDYLPEEARGGTEICVLDPVRETSRETSRDGSSTIAPITHNEPPLWDFRTVWSPDGKQIAFCRCGVGRPSELWVMNSDGSNQRFLTRGYDDLGADHPVWL